MSLRVRIMHISNIDLNIIIIYIITVTVKIVREKGNKMCESIPRTPVKPTTRLFFNNNNNNNNIYFL
jgi:transposase